MKVINGHLIATNSDSSVMELPQPITDVHGDVVLDWCFICGRGEGELNEKCSHQHTAGPYNLSKEGWIDEHHIDLNAPLHSAFAEILVKLDPDYIPGLNGKNKHEKERELMHNAWLFQAAPDMLQSMIDVILYIDQVGKIDNTKQANTLNHMITKRLKTAIVYAVSGKRPRG